MDNRRGDWRTILLMIGSLGGALTAFSLAALMLLYAALGFSGGDFGRNAPSLLQGLVLASGLAFAGALFLPAAYYSFRRLRGNEVPIASLKLLKIWPAVLLLMLWVSVSILAQLFANQDILKWFTPPLYLLAIATPVYFLLRLATGGLKAGSRQLGWGVLATTMAFGTTLSMFAEGALVLLGLFGIAIFLALHPEQQSIFRQLVNQLTSASGSDQILSVLSPWVNNPIAFLLALLFFSGFTPIIEETAKSVATWTISDHLKSPGQGFVVGALSGAGFGLLESLLASATPNSSWGSTLMVRGGSTMMHIMTASLTGWGIGWFRTRGRGARMIGMYTLAVFLHGSWNAAVVMLAFGSLRTGLNGNAPDVTSMALIAMGGTVLVILLLSIPLAIGRINQKLRSASAAAVDLPPQKNGGEDRPGSGQGAEGVQ